MCSRTTARARAGAAVLRAAQGDPRAAQSHRYGKAQIEERTRESQRLDKKDTGIKLLSVASDVLGVSGRAMLQALVEGTRDPALLADLAKGPLRKKIPQLREALRGRFGAHHALLVGTILAKLEFLDEAIAALSAEIEVTSPHAPREQRVGRQTRPRDDAQGLQVAPTHLNEAAKAGGRCRATYLAAQYAGLRGRRGATVAVAHSIAVAAYHILTRRQPYHELGPDYFTRRHSREHHTLVRQIQALGYNVTLQPAKVAA